MKPFADHFSGHAADYARHRPTYPQTLYRWLADQSQGHDLAWDVATGNGQAALALAESFAAVVATDASAAQVAEAPQHPRVSFRVEPAEASSLQDQSVDLVTVAQALHWFDHPRFSAELRRVLRPGGLFAAWCYALCHVNPAVDEVLLRLYEADIGPYWPPERQILERGYVDVDLPITRLDAPAFEMTARWTLPQFVAYLGTWSACQRFRKATGIDPLVGFTATLAPLWPADEVQTVRFPLALRVGRLT